MSDINHKLCIATDFFENKDYHASEQLLREVLLEQPLHSRANELLAYIYGDRGDMQSAFKLLSTACNHAECSSEALYYLGSLKLRLGLHTESIVDFKKSIAKAGDFFEALHDLGTAYAHLNKPEEALNYFKKCLLFQKNSFELFFNIGSLLEVLNHNEEAITYYDKAIAINPRYTEAWLNKANALKNLSRHEESIAHYDKAIQINPNYAEAWSNKANVLRLLNRNEDAIIHYDRAIEVKPDYHTAIFNKGNTLKSLNNFQQALNCYEKAIEIKPNYFEAIWNKSLTNLCIGNLIEGFDLYDYRWKQIESAPYRHSNIPELKTLIGINNLNVLVWHEQGFGDTIQFSRYIPKLLALGAKITFEVQPQLQSLFQNQFDCLITSNIFDYAKFDFQIPLLSLPKLFGTDIQNIPSITKLEIDSQKLSAWKEKLNLSSQKINIGLANSGNSAHINDKNRSIPIKYFHDIFDIGKFYIVQKDLRPEDKEFIAKNPEITYLGNQINDFTDTASITHNLDLIISVDTSLIHLAGSLSKKAFLLLPFNPEWRWPLNRKDSPWYPTIKIFRQRLMNEWNPVISEVKKNISLSQN